MLKLCRTAKLLRRRRRSLCAGKHKWNKRPRGEGYFGMKIAFAPPAENPGGVRISNLPQLFTLDSAPGRDLIRGRS